MRKVKVGNEKVKIYMKLKCDLTLDILWVSLGFTDLDPVVTSSYHTHIKQMFSCAMTIAIMSNSFTLPQPLVVELY